MSEREEQAAVDSSTPEAGEPDKSAEGDSALDGAASVDDASPVDDVASADDAGPADSRELSNFSTNRPVAVLMVFLAAVVFGSFSYGRLPITLMPELSYPTLTVRTEYPGAAPEEVENDISRPVEDTLGVVGGLSRISSISRAGVSDVVLEFSWDTDMSEALQDTLEKLDLVFLPSEAERPLILRFDPSLDPVLELSLSGFGQSFEGEDGLRRLRRIAELQVRRALEPIKGVAAVRLRGGLEEEIHVRIDEEQLRRTGLSIQRVIDRLRQENVNVAGGTVKEGRTEYMVRTLNEFQSLEQIENTVLARLSDRDVRVRDVADVRWGHKEREILTHTEGNESVQIDLYKEADANMVAMSKRVRDRLGDFDVKTCETARKEPAKKEEKPKFGSRPGGEGFGKKAGLAEELCLAEGIGLSLVADRSVFIESSINEVRSTAIIGGLLAVAVLFLFLRNFQSTIIIAVSIPISLMVTFAPLNLLGVSLNVMSLGGLALGIGMLVDSSIVVLESIFRCREEGDSIVTSAVRGTQEVRGAVVASTLTSIAVFFPMVFVEGVAGQAFGDLGLAVVISLLASVVVAVAFIPMLASRKYGEALPNLDDISVRRPKGAVLQLWRQDFAAAKAWLGGGPVLRFLPWLIFVIYLAGRLLIHGVLMVVGVAAYALLIFVTKLVMLLVGLLVPLLRGLTWLPLQLVQRALNALGEVYPKILAAAVARPLAMVLLTAALFAFLWSQVTQLESELLPEVHQGEFTVEVALPVGTPLEETNRILQPVERVILEDKANIESLLVTFGYDAANSQRSDEGEHTARFKVLLDSSDPRLEEEVIERLRSRFEQIPDLDARVVRPVLFSFKTPIEVEIHGDNLDRLKTWAATVRDRLAALPELADVETTLRTGAPEMQVIYDRDRLARYDLDIAQVAELVRNSVKGFEATRYNLIDRRVPVIVRFTEDDRQSVDDVRSLEVNPGSERPIPLSAVATVDLGEGPSEVRRIDGRRVALVRANLAEGSLGAAAVRIQEELQQLDWPSDMTFFLAGQNQEWERSRGSLLLALSLSIFLVYVIMAAQFESLVQPLVIMFSIPLAFLGTVIALRWLDISLSIVVFLGMIMLAGIVVNNAIVLIDYINRLKQRGLERRDAIVKACSVRLRPILMTTSTTVLGLTPMALGLGDGAEIRTPMAIAVISGLIVSTILTLLIIPSLYSLIDGLRDAVLNSRSVRPDSEDDSEGDRRELLGDDAEVATP